MHTKIISIIVQNANYEKIKKKKFPADLAGERGCLNMSLEFLNLLAEPINNALAEPAKAVGDFFANIIYNHPLVCYEKGRRIINENNLYRLKQCVEQEMSQIPEKQILEPNSKTASAIYNAVMNTDTEELQSMFSKLIAATVDEKKEPFVHPSLSEILKNLSPCDAAIFEYIGKECQKEEFVKILKIKMKNVKETVESLGIVDYPKYSFSDISLSIENLFRLNLICNINSRGGMHRFISMKDNEYLEWNCIRKLLNDGFEVKDFDTYAINITELGKRLFTICC